MHLIINEIAPHNGPICQSSYIRPLRRQNNRQLFFRLIALRSTRCYAEKVICDFNLGNIHTRYE